MASTDGFVPDILRSLYGRVPVEVQSAVPLVSPDGSHTVVLDHVAYFPPQGIHARVILMRLELGQATLDDRAIAVIAESCQGGREFLMVVPSARWEAASLRVHRMFEGRQRGLWQVASWPGVVYGFEPRRREEWARLQQA